ncbi:MAG: CapA family protein [Chloroflexi bacterium]|nr:CapA family protein [Chloroflexota bacterium]
MVRRLTVALVLSMLIGTTFLPPIPARAYGERVVVVAGGDIMMGRWVEQVIRQNGGDFDYPLRRVKHVIESADLAMANMEGPVTAARVWCPNCMVLGSLPEAAGALANAGFDAVTLANNHAGDFGARGVLDSVANLDSKGIAHAGAGANEAEARKPALLVKNGVRFAILGYNEVPPVGYAAGPSRPGSAWLTVEAVREDVTAARGIADVVIVAPHWGIEYVSSPTRFQVDVAHAAIDAGADLVIGNHPHWVQEVEIYNGKPIFYALGNLVLDQMWSMETRQGALLRLTFSGSTLETAEILPVQIENYAQPYLVGPNEPTYRQVIARMGLKQPRIRLADHVYFPETKNYVSYAFLKFWEERGGLPVFGYPLTSEIEDVDEQGVVRTVQYFERARFEYYPEYTGTPPEVQLARLGSLLTSGRAFERSDLSPSSSERAYFPETGHSVWDEFKAYWERNGGLEIFGYPISEELVESGMTIQYFERARFELHPVQGGAGNQVLLGRLGAEYLDRWMAPDAVAYGS